MARDAIDIDVNLSDPTSKRALMAALSPLQGVYDVSIRPVRITRSNAANRYLFGVIVKLYAGYLSECDGRTVDKEEAFLDLKRRFLKRIIVNKETGEVVAVTVKRSSQLSKVEFGEFIEECVKHLETECDTPVPPPDLYGVQLPTGAKA